MVTWDDFDKIWASTSPLTPYDFSDHNYSQGWNFVGSTPPARQMWDSIQKKNDEKFKYLRDNFGTPNIVTSSSQMTDTDKVYVYMGSEAGWNNGHWYYYDEGTSSWEDGGVYNSVAFVTDTTLSIAGQPADAKATGDALALKADLAGCTFTGNVNVNADLSVTGTSTFTGDITASVGLTVAGDSSLTNLSVSGTTTLTGTSTAQTPSADDNSTKIATTEYVQTEIKPIETDVTINDKRITNIEKLLQGNLYDYQTDSTSGYTKSVPAGAMPYAGLEQIGGKTVVWNQLCNVGTRTGTGSSITTVFNAGVSIVSGHKYYAKADFTSQGQPHLDIYAYINSANVVVARLSTPQIFTSAYSTTSNGTSNRVEGNMWYFLPASSGFSSGDIVTNVMLIDLTLMFGAGNEPTTVAEFESMFPASYYSFNEGELLSAGVTSVISKDANNVTLQAYPIPAEIQALEGYGWSCPDHYNYIDYENKKFMQEVGSRAYVSGDESDSTVITDGTTTYYPLNPAIETDISEYLTDDNLINVESGGTLTFPNSNGTDYLLPVPSEETYMIDLQEALGG